MPPDAVLYFPKPKTEGSKNEIIHSFVLGEHFMIAHAALSFWQVSPKEHL